MTSKTMFLIQENPANALALNKDNTQVVIAGRNVFKVFTLHEDRFEEVWNLRVGKNLNLNFSCNDVAWNLLEDHLLATAATNGAVVLWNLNKASRSKQEHVFVDHKRTVNKVSFHMTEPMWLISGSQDGTMKCFDLRIKEAVKTFYSNTESVRDVQFSPHQPYTFAAVSENGHVQLWDVRRPDRYFQHFTAHSGPIFACDWHPETSWLATASRDKTVKVWDLSVKPTCEYTINTIASVGRIKWRPQRKFHIASCALVLDCSINIWDIRRPYIPFASFNEHKDVPTGVAWRGDPQSFLSTSRDCTLYHHCFQDADRPAGKANPQAVAFSSKGEAAYACKTNVNAPSAVKNLTSLMRKIPPSNDTFCIASSTMHTFRSTESKPITTSEREWWIYCAQNYILTGKLSEICDHNAGVIARSGRRTDIMNVWICLKIMLDFAPANTLKSTSVTKDDPINLTQMKNLNLAAGKEQNNGHDYDKKSLQDDGLDEACAVGGGGGDDETETDEIPENTNNFTTIRSGDPRLLNSNKRLPRGDFTFGLEDEDPLFTTYNAAHYNDNLLIDNDPNDWVLEKEAFPLRHEIQDRSPPPEQFLNNSPEINDSGSATVDDQPPQLHIYEMPVFKPFDYIPVIEQALRHHVEINDLQTTVCVLIALGEKRKLLTTTSLATQEHWLTEYIEMLRQFKLHNVATQIIKLSWIPSISQMTQQSTTFRICCGTCSKPLHKSATFCGSCKSSNHALCSICNQIVRGMYVWCRGCTHGGHHHHLKEWFRKHRECPTGCGHQCEYNIFM